MQECILFAKYALLVCSLHLLACMQVSSIFDNNLVTGQAQSGLWFGKTDDLWSWGKPKGWGGPWRCVPAHLGCDS